MYGTHSMWHIEFDHRALQEFQWQERDLVESCMFWLQTCPFCKGYSLLSPTSPWTAKICPSPCLSTPPPPFPFPSLTKLCNVSKEGAAHHHDPEWFPNELFSTCNGPRSKLEPNLKWCTFALWGRSKRASRYMCLSYFILLTLNKMCCSWERNSRERKTHQK